MVRDQLFPHTSRFAHLTFAHRVSSLPWLVKDRAPFRARQIWCVLTQKTGLFATESLASRVPPPPGGHQIKGAVYTVCFFYQELDVFGAVPVRKKKKKMTMGEFHCTSRSYLDTFFYARTTTSRRAPNWSSEEAHLVNTILNIPHRYRVSVGRLIATKGSWPHLSIVSPALHPPERPSHTSTPKHRFWREMRM